MKFLEYSGLQRLSEWIKKILPPYNGQDEEDSYLAANKSWKEIKPLSDSEVDLIIEKLTNPFSISQAAGLTWEDIYPVGALYLSYMSTSPAKLFGGSWMQITNVVLRAANDVDTGGSDTTTLVVDNLPPIRYWTSRMASGFTQDTNVGSGTFLIAKGGDYGFIPATGGSSAPLNNLPAYQDIYCWRRTA